MHIRRANHSDIDNIERITKKAFENYIKLSGAKSLSALSEDKSDIQRDIDTKLVLVAVSENDLLGCVRVEISGDNAYLSRFAVNESCRNSGVGTRLMESVDEEMKKNGVKKISLHSASKILPLIRFYYGKGFYIESVDDSMGYIRATLVKDYDK